MCRFREAEGISYDNEVAVPVTVQAKSVAEAMRLARAEKKFQVGNTITATQFQLELTRFLSNMIEGAGVLEAFHMTPDGRPWREQPRWRRQLWLSYQQGAHERSE